MNEIKSGIRKVIIDEESDVILVEIEVDPRYDKSRGKV